MVYVMNKINFRDPEVTVLPVSWSSVCGLDLVSPAFASSFVSWAADAVGGGGSWVRSTVVE